MKKTILICSVLMLLLFGIGAVLGEENEQPLQGELSFEGDNVEEDGATEKPVNDTSTGLSEPVEEQEWWQNQTMEGNETKNQYENNDEGNFEDVRYTWRNRYRYEIQEGIKNETVVKECNISKKDGKMYIHSNEYQNGMEVEIKEQSRNRLKIKVSAEFKEGKVLVLNLEENAFKIKNSQKLVVKFDGKEMEEADIDDVIDGSGTNAQYAKAIGEDGSQYVIYIPHFSEHTITFEILGSKAAAESVSLVSVAIGAAVITIVILVILIAGAGKFRKN